MEKFFSSSIDQNVSGLFKNYWYSYTIQICLKFTNDGFVACY